MQQLVKNALTQAKQFKEVTDVTGIVLTKLDGTARGGIVLAIRNELHLPVKLVGLGEKWMIFATFHLKNLSMAYLRVWLHLRKIRVRKWQLKKTNRINALFEFYEPLLTKKQMNYIALYYRDDFSLGEIAENYEVSRQAVYDNIKRTEKF